MHSTEKEALVRALAHLGRRGFRPHHRLQISSPDSIPIQRPRSNPLESASNSNPLVSCIMPTANRPVLALQAIHYFLKQTYPNRELIIIDDEPGHLREKVPADSRIQYLTVPVGTTIGAKRNRGCEVARGVIFAQWDDDDWYGADRLKVQVEPIIGQTADITGFHDTTFFDLERWEFWKCNPTLHRHMFVEDVPSGTLVYHRRVWEKLARYPNQSLAEDAFLLKQALRRGARLCRVPGEHSFLYLRHGTNTWKFGLGRFVDPTAWFQIEEPACFTIDRAFYQSQSAAGLKKAATLGSETSLPLVSCILPTANRRGFISQSIQYFLRQSYPNRELIIVDDGTDPISDLVPAGAQITYHRLTLRQSVGAKRNVACQEARGDIIVHWDDDDWTSPEWIRSLVSTLTNQQADIVGLKEILFLEPATDQAWVYRYPSHSQDWVYGGTLCYWKDYWRNHPFQNRNVGEDAQFIWSVPNKKVVSLQTQADYVAIIHPQNTSPKHTSGHWWQPVPPETVWSLLGNDGSFYHNLNHNQFIVSSQ